MKSQLEKNLSLMRKIYETSGNSNNVLNSTNFNIKQDYSYNKKYSQINYRSVNHVTLVCKDSIIAKNPYVSAYSYTSSSNVTILKNLNNNYDNFKTYDTITIPTTLFGKSQYFFYNICPNNVIINPRKDVKLIKKFFINNNISDFNSYTSFKIKSNLLITNNVLKDCLVQKKTNNHYDLIKFNIPYILNKDDIWLKNFIQENNFCNNDTNYILDHFTLLKNKWKDVYDNDIIFKDYFDIKFISYIENTDLNDFHKNLVEVNFFNQFKEQGLVFFKETEKEYLSLRDLIEKK